jgi:hypothetical protein
MTPEVYRRAIWAAAGIGAAVLLLLASFAVASTAGPTAHLQYVLFWTAAAAGMIPLALLAVHAQTPHRVRVAMVWVAAALTTVPKLLRTPWGPLYSDEFGHLYQVKRVLDEGMFPAGENPFLKIAHEFPLMHWLTAGLHELGFDLWGSAMAVSLTAHVLTLVGVYHLVRLATGNVRAATAGALFYTAQPGWLFFSSQFAYETLGICFLVWTLVAVFAARKQDAWRRPVLLVAVPVLALATAVTHHFAAIVLAGALLCFTLVGFSRRDDHKVRSNDTWVAALSTALIAGWLWTRFGDVWGYYSPTAGSVFDKLGNPLDGGGTRAVFSGSRAPWWERAAGLLFPFTTLALAAWSTIRAGRRVLAWNRRVVFLLTAASFFASLPFLFVTEGAEAAHRWWSYAYLGLAVLLAEGLRARWERGDAHGETALWRRAVWVVLLAITAVGGVVSGTNVAYRFPGPLEIGNDARSIAPEGRAIAEQLLAKYGPGVYTGQKVLADRYTNQQLVGYGEQITTRPSPGYPAWDLFRSTDRDTLIEVGQHLRHDNVAYVVVDTRMATDRPAMGYWFNRGEPGVFGDELYPQAAIEKFRCASWATFVGSEGPLELYRLDVENLVATGDACQDRGSALGAGISYTAQSIAGPRS